MNRQASQVDVVTFKMVIDILPDGVMLTNEEKTILYANDALSHITGYPKEEILGKKAGFLKSNHHGELFYQMMWDSIDSKGYWNGDIWDINREGELILIWLQVIKFLDQDQKLMYVAYYKDLSDIRTGNQKLLVTLKKDPLTGVFNRTFFYEKALYVLNQRQDKYMLFFDIDFFKTLNDTQGHLKGDQALIHFAQTLKRNFAHEIVSRFGGDEFIVLVTSDLTLDMIIHKINTMEDELKNVIISDDLIKNIQFSTGVIETPSYQGDLRKIIHDADMAMYRAKQQRKRFEIGL